MANTLRQIQINFGSVMQVADRLDDHARMLESGYRDVQRVIDETERAWQGNNARVFSQKARKREDAMRKTAQDYLYFAEELRRIAREIYAAEMQALQIVQSIKG